MDLHTATPVEIDGRITELDRKLGRVAAERRRTADAPRPDTDKLAQLDTQISELNAQLDELDSEFRARPWNRVYVVMGGRVHSTPNCRNGYFATTQWGWMPEWSGVSWDDLVQAAGDRACSWCVPNAPSTPSRIEHPDEAVERADRTARQKAKADREAKAAAKAVVDPTTGDWIRDDLGSVIKTERTVKSRAMDELWWSYFAHRSGNTNSETQHQTEARRYSNALADKWGRDREELYTELADKAWKKFQRG